MIFINPELLKISQTAMAISLSQKQWPAGSPYINLPRPVALESSGWQDGFKTLVDKAPHFAEALEQTTPNPTINISNLGFVLAEFFANSIDPQQLSAIGLGNNDKLRLSAGAFCTNKAFRARSGAIIETTRDLDKMLSHSDISSDLPVRLFAAPYKANYLHFSIPIRLQDTDGHFGEVVGAYVFYHDGILTLGDGDFTDGHWMRSDSAALWNLQEGQRVKFIEFSVQLRIPASDGSVSYQQLSTWVYMAADSDESIQKVLSERVIGRPEIIGLFQLVIEHITKVFLYMGLADMRSQTHDEFTKAKAAIVGLGPKKRGKAQRQLRMLYDRIVVGPNRSDSVDFDYKNFGHVAPHMRRGHFRMQRHGVGNYLQKVIFIAPVLVRSDLVSVNSPQPKKYVVRA